MMRYLLCPAAVGGALSDAAIRLCVRLSVPTGLSAPQLARRAAPKPAAPPLFYRPPELCGLRIRPRTDVDPPRSAAACRLSARDNSC